MAKTLAEMRASLIAKEEKKTKFNDNKKGGGDKSYYPFWNNPDNSTATVRFLPDANQNNDWFWSDRTFINMPFAGIKGSADPKPFVVKVPCVEMFGKTCPVMQEINDLKWWKGDDDSEEKKLARIYYRKISHLYQAFVVTSPIKEEDLPENPIRKLTLNKSIHDMVKAALMDPEIEYSPINYDDGIDFKITKTKKGEYADYSTSQFSRKNRSLSEIERAAIAKFGLFDLKSFLPKEPTDADLKIQMQMFEDSVSNELFDAEKYKIYAPKVWTPNNGGSDTETVAEQETVAVAPVAKVAETIITKQEPAPVKLKSSSENTESESGSDKQSAAAAAPRKNPQEILEMLRAKNKKQA